LSKGLGIFFSRNLASEITFGQLDIFAENTFTDILESSIDSLFRRRLLLQKLLRVTLIKKMVARKKTVFRKKILKASKFREKFLKKSFFEKYLSTSISQFFVGRYGTFKIFLRQRFFFQKRFFFNLLLDLIFYNRYQGYFSLQKLKPKAYLLANRSYLLELFTAITPRFISVIINHVNAIPTESSVFDKTKHLKFSFLNAQLLEPYEASSKFQEESNKLVNYELRSFLLKNAFFFKKSI